MKTFIIIATLVAVTILLVRWGPWMLPHLAEQQATMAFENEWEGVVDGCGLDCEGCGATEVRETSLGYMVRLEFACGMIPEDSPEYHQFQDVFVSNLGTVHGF